MTFGKLYVFYFARYPAYLSDDGVVAMNWLNQLFESLNKHFPNGGALIALVLVFAILVVMKFG